MPHVSVLGTVIVVFVLIAVGGTFKWMFAVPRQPGRGVVSARQSLRIVKNILVPIVGNSFEDRAVVLSCRLGRMQGARILLTYVVEVPYNIGLSDFRQEYEDKAKAALEHAKEIVAGEGLESAVRIQRSRQAWEGIVRAAEEEGSELIVMGVQRPTRPDDRALGQFAEQVLRRAPCEVIIDRP